MNYAFSVIIPVYNTEVYLPVLFSDLDKQNCSEYYEIIFVNDGSTDNSLSLVKDYIKKKNISNISYYCYSISNSGAASARNFALSKACGEYIIFIDSDDRISSNYFRTLFNVGKGCKADMVLCNWKDNRGNIKIKEESDYQIRELSYEDCCKILINAANLDINISDTLWAKMFKKDIISPIQLANIRTSEDVVYTFKALKKSKKIVYTSDCYYLYTINRENSLLNTLIESDIQDQIHEKMIIINEILNDFPDLRKSLLLYYIDYSVLLCVWIISSKKIKNKNKLYHRYISYVRNNLFLFLKSDYLLGKKVRAFFMALGYYPATILLYIKHTFFNIKRSIEKE